VGVTDVFTEYRIDEQLLKALDRKVWLPSGGTLVIDRTEAMTVVDVNTGKFTGSGGNLEETVTRNNLEAAEEIVRQLRLRDIGGIVVIDFIDMVLESNRDLVLRRLTESLARDRTRHQVSEVTSLGLVQLTRKRLGTGLIEAFSSTCPHCGGRGLLLHSDPVDSAPSNGRKSESGGRRGRRSKKKGAEEPTVAKVLPAHAPGEHPMFKAMAAGATGASEAAGEGDGEAEESAEEVTAQVENEAEEPATAALADTEPDDFEDNGDDSDDEDDLDDDDLDDEDLGDDEDLDLDDDDSDDSDDSDDDEDDDDIDDEDSAGADAGPAFGRPRRRRAAGRPAGPPIHVD
jgi:ribonuclease E